MKNALYTLLILFLSLSRAQETSAYLVSLEDYISLPSKTIYGLATDQQGTLFAATENGLFRMNDSGVKLLRAQEQKGRAVFNLKVDKKGTVWMSNLSQQILQLRNDSLYLQIKLENEIDGGLPQIATDGETITVLQRDHIYEIFEDDLLNKINTSNSNVLRSNIILRDGVPYFFQGNSLYRLRWDQVERVKTYQALEGVKGSPHLFYHHRSWHLAVNNNEGNKIFRLGNSYEEVSYAVSLKKLVINKVKTIGKKIYVSTSKGLFIFYKNTNGTYESQTFLKNRTITDVIEDINNSLWISTYNDGIYLMPDSSVQQIDLPDRANYLITEMLVTDNSFQFIVDKSQLFTQKTDGTFHKVPIKSQSDQRLVQIDLDRVALLNQEIFETDAKNIISKKIAPGIKDVLKFSDGYILATYKQIIKTDSLFRTQKNINGRATQLEYLNENLFISVFKGNLKIIDLDLNVKETLEYNGSPITPQKYKSHGRDQIIILDENGVLIRAVKKLEKWHLEEIEFEKSETDFDIRDFDISNDQLFILTDKGLIRKSLVNGAELRSDILNSIQWDEVTNLQVGAQSIYLLTSNKILKISQEIFEKSYAIPVFVERHSKINKISMPHNFRELDLVFEDNLIFPETGYVPFIKDQEQWVPYKNNHRRIINDLKSGDHDLQIRHEHLFTAAISPSLIIPVYIQTPYYFKWWFITGAIITALLLVWIIYFYRGRYVKNKMQAELDRETKEKNMIQLKLENLRSQMNPHFVFNSLNSLQDYILSNNKLLASSYLVRFSRLMRMYLNHSRRAFISLGREIDALKLYVELEKERYGDSFEYAFSIDENIDHDQSLIPSLLLQPYVENAITHGLHHKKGKKHLEISFSRAQGSGIKIIIEDNGVGRNRARELSADTSHESFSMIANKSRLDLMNKYHNANLDVEIIDLTGKRGEPLGTRVVINLYYINP